MVFLSNSKHLHEIHHREPQVNYGFVFFPIGDLLIGTYKGQHKKKKAQPSKIEPSTDEILQSTQTNRNEESNKN